MNKFLLALMVGMISLSVQAQRVTDRLTRGLVAIPQGDKTGQDSNYGMSGSGIFVCWRKLPSDYFDTKYNLYRGTTRVAENLTTTNYQDNDGTKTSKYKVVPVVKGVEQTDKAVECTPWEHQYWDIKVQKVLNRNGADVTSGYSLNDCSVADVDGDGEMEFVVKRRNGSGNLRSASNTTDFNLHECYKMDGTRLWWIDMGPNLMAGADEQFDLILYDWDQDGKAEALMRGADNMIIHTASGKAIKIGDMTSGLNGIDRAEYMGVGNEFLLYLNGETGEPYDWDGSENWTPAAYPLPQFETDETYGSSNVWGDLGHRMQKHYFGAPYLDGRTPSIFLGRGCYTRHKFCALDVNPVTHQLTQRWRWNCYDRNSAWYGNGFHNFAIADVDMDGRDEIVFGSMIIDDNGYGLSTTGFGHGDAQHCGDFDPYRWGLEQFVCLESSSAPGIAYTDGTTSTLRFTTGTGGDNGRCMAGNFQGTYPGAIGNTFGYDVISLVSDKVITGMNMASDDYMNMRIYWDGDLLDEFMDSPGVEKAPYIYKYGNEVGTNRSYKNGRCWGGGGSLNNSSKNNPCFLGDIIGDWREEIVNRMDATTLRINISSYPSPHAITSLWYDHEYRNGMTWQSVGYNQPPHVSFFLGELEGITKEPPALTLERRIEVNGTIRTTSDHLLVSGYENKTIAVQEGASPYILTVNAPALVAGSGAQQAVSSTPKQPARTITTYTTTLIGGAFSGTTRIVKQGEGVLVLPNVTEKHTGETDVWQGTLQFDGTFESSPLWLNRHTRLISNGGKFMGGLKADYNATIYPGGQDNVGNITVSEFSLGFGSRIVYDFAGNAFDRVDATKLAVEAKTDAVWVNYGPRYKAPVLQFTGVSDIAAGTYVLGTIGSIEGDLSQIILEGFGNNKKAELAYADGRLLLIIEDMREATNVIWNGTSDLNTWQQAVTKTFLVDGQRTYGAQGDHVMFDDNAANTNVVVKGAVSPADITFNNERKNYTLSGDSIVGGGTITKNGQGILTINNWNHTGATTINGGTVSVVMLANSSGQQYGSLGGVSSAINLYDGATLETNGIIITDQSLNVSGEVTVSVPSGKSVIFNKAIWGNGATINKIGAGSMETGTQANTYAKLVIKGGTVTANHSSDYADMLPATIEFQGGTLWTSNNEGTNINNSSNLIVPEGKTGTFYGGYRSTYTGTLTGAGTFNVYTGGVRCYYDGDWSEFSGTINIGKNNRQNKKSYDPDFMYRNIKGLPLATVNVAANTRFNNQGKTITVKKLGGKGTVTGSGTWIVDCDEDFELTTEIGITSERTDDYGNTIAVSASPLTKRGSGKMKMTEGMMNGTLAIEGGAVTVYKYKPATLLNGTNPTIVRNGGRFIGQAMVNSMNVMSGGEALPCGSAVNETTPGTITVNNTIAAQPGATFTFLRNASKNSVINTKNLTMNGTVKVVLLSGYTPKAGDAFTLWNCTGTFSGTPQFDLPELPTELAWDTSGVASATGVLRIVDTTVGVKTLADNAIVDCKVYTIDGVRVADIQTVRSEVHKEVSCLPLRAGAYIIAIHGMKGMETMKIIVK